jgi:hypothetical protein
VWSSEVPSRGLRARRGKQRASDLRSITEQRLEGYRDEGRQDEILGRKEGKEPADEGSIMIRGSVASGMLQEAWKTMHAELARSPARRMNGVEGWRSKGRVWQKTQESDEKERLSEDGTGKEEGVHGLSGECEQSVE